MVTGRLLLLHFRERPSYAVFGFTQLLQFSAAAPVRASVEAGLASEGGHAKGNMNQSIYTAAGLKSSLWQICGVKKTAATRARPAAQAHLDTATNGIAPLLNPLPAARILLDKLGSTNPPTNVGGYAAVGSIDCAPTLGASAK